MHHRLLVPLLLLALAASGLAIHCDTCSGKCNCLRPRMEECPDHMKCYMVMSSDNKFIEQKGCALSCNDLAHPTQCQDCTGDLCNRSVKIPFGYTGYKECTEDSSIGGGVGVGGGAPSGEGGPANPIGSGVAPPGPPGGIGHGAKPDPNGVASAVLNSLVALFVVLCTLI
uniref:UPAR/Ly6 domain-containing protein n=1 Tax=Steinernema glaseri TaxID=37863 RepID=A0A1I7ZPS9_9BILA